jgi:hypothetical protein
MVLKRIFGSNRDEVTGGGENCIMRSCIICLYSLPGIIRIIKSRRMRWVDHVARMGEKRNVCGLLVRKPEGERRLRRLRHR